MCLGRRRVAAHGDDTVVVRTLMKLPAAPWKSFSALLRVRRQRHEIQRNPTKRKTPRFRYFFFFSSLSLYICDVGERVCMCYCCHLNLIGLLQCIRGR